MSRRPDSDSPVTPRERQDFALDVYMAGGRSYSEIAELRHPKEADAGIDRKLYASAGSARNAVMAALARRRGVERKGDKPTTHDDAKSMHVARLERLLRARWGEALGGDKDANADARALLNQLAEIQGFKLRPGAPPVEDSEGVDVVDELHERRNARRRTTGPDGGAAPAATPPPPG